MGRKITGIDIAVIHHRKLIQARRQERIVQSFEFLEAWDLFSNEERKRIIFLLKKIKPDEVKILVDNKIHGELGKLSTNSLRRLASNYYIKNYSRKSKEQLINEIKERQANEGCTDKH